MPLPHSIGSFVCRVLSLCMHKQLFFCRFLSLCTASQLCKVLSLTTDGILNKVLSLSIGSSLSVSNRFWSLSQPCRSLYQSETQNTNIKNYHVVFFKKLIKKNLLKNPSSSACITSCVCLVLFLHMESEHHHLKSTTGTFHWHT